LYLIQFTAPLTPEAKAQLKGLGISLFHYVPDDAYVARFQGVRPEQLQALPFVHWFGEYRPEHKVHRNLLNASGSQTNGPLGVAILMVPRANAAEIAQVRAL